MTSLPKGIGPHEGIEFDLLRGGKKNVALFFEIEPDGLEKILEEGFCLLQFRQFEMKGVIYFTRIVFRDGYENDALRLKTIVSERPKKICSEREHEIGRILSYSYEEVEAFLRHATEQGRRGQA